jgi:hypothetical protein
MRISICESKDFAADGNELRSRSMEHVKTNYFDDYDSSGIFQCIHSLPNLIDGIGSAISLNTMCQVKLLSGVLMPRSWEAILLLENHPALALGALPKIK